VVRAAVGRRGDQGGAPRRVVVLIGQDDGREQLPGFQHLDERDVERAGGPGHALPGAAHAVAGLAGLVAVPGVIAVAEGREERHRGDLGEWGGILAFSEAATFSALDTFDPVAEPTDVLD
jgi:hypothetical protein